MKSLNFYPYTVLFIQELKPHDFQPRLQYAVRLRELAENEPNFFDKLLMSDETHFHLNGFVNKQNCRFWAKENPRAVHQRKLHPVKRTAWCAITANEIIGPYFFEVDDGNAVAVIGERDTEGCFEISCGQLLKIELECGSCRMEQQLILQEKACNYSGNVLMEE